MKRLMSVSLVPSVVTVNNNTTFSGAVTNTAGMGKNGAGTLTFSGAAANTYGSTSANGNTTVSAGTLKLNKTAGVNAIAGGGTLLTFPALFAALGSSGSAAVVAIALALCPKVGATISAIPPGVLGGATIVLYGLVGVLGIRIWLTNHVDFSKPVNQMTAAIPLIIGIAGIHMRRDLARGKVFQSLRSLLPV